MIMPVYLIPNTPEWLSAVEKFNPKQAAATRELLKLSGRADVCSICGDRPATDFKRVDFNLPAQAFGTLRLCDDCLQIRRNVYGEVYERFENSDL